MIGTFLFLSIRHLLVRRSKLTHNDFLAFSIVAGYGTILIGNFFGFSVVIINIFFYILPALVFMLIGKINYDKYYSLSLTNKTNYQLTTSKKISIAVAGLIGFYLIYTLVNFWTADRYYYFGYNYDHQVQDYQKAYSYLKIAVEKRPSEPVFRDEFAYNNAILGAEIVAQNQKLQNAQATQTARQLIQTAINDTNQVTTRQYHFLAPVGSHRRRRWWRTRSWGSSAAACPIPGKAAGRCRPPSKWVLPANVLSAALYSRFDSQGRAGSADKLLSAMRLGFGGRLEKKS